MTEPGPIDVTREDNRMTAIRLDLVDKSLLVVRGQTFVNVDVHLDGRAFIDCTFINCRLSTNLGYFAFGGHTQLFDRIELDASKWLHTFDEVLSRFRAVEGQTLSFQGEVH